MEAKLNSYKLALPARPIPSSFITGVDGICADCLRSVTPSTSFLSSPPAPRRLTCRSCIERQLELDWLAAIDEFNINPSPQSHWPARFEDAFPRMDPPEKQRRRKKLQALERGATAQSRAEQQKLRDEYKGHCDARRKANQVNVEGE